MALHLRQSTAVDVLIGPFLDITDAKTAETGETPAIKLSKNGQALAAKSDATVPVHDADGYHNCEFDTTDTNTVGTLVLTAVGTATALPVRHEYQVIEEAAYDAIYAASADPKADINVGSIDANAITATSIAADAITAAKIADGAIDAATFAAGAINAAAIANGAIDAATFAAGAIDAAAIAADAGTEIGTAVWATTTRALTVLDEDSTTLDLDATIRAAVGLASANLDTQIGDLPTNAELATSQGTADDATLAAIAALTIPTAAAVADAVWDEDATGHQTTGTFGQAIGDPVADTNTIYGAVVTGAAGATVAADIIAVKAETAAILVDTGTTLDAAIAVIDGIVDAILLDTAEIGAAGAGLTAINLPNQTMDIVGSITGNLSGSVGSVTGLTVAHIDAAISTRATQTSVDDVPTNAELATALGTADDAVLAAIAALNNITAAAVLAAGDVDGFSLEEALKLALAIVVGKASGGGTGTEVFRAADDSKDRVTSTNDAAGNRTALTLDATG